MLFPVLHKLPCRPVLVSLSLVLAQLAPAAHAESTSFTQSLAASASSDAAIAEWYRTTGYDTLWTGAEDAARREALLAALSTAKDHGLPVARYDVAALLRDLRAAETEGDRGRVEVTGGLPDAAQVVAVPLQGVDEGRPARIGAAP